MNRNEILRTIRALRLHIKAIAPINGVSMGDPEDRTTWKIGFLPEATEQQRKAAQEALLSFVVPDEEPPELTPKDILQLLLDNGVIKDHDIAQARAQKAAKV